MQWIYFSISAFSDYYGMLPETFNVTGGYPSGEKLFFKHSWIINCYICTNTYVICIIDITELLSVNISVYFNSKVMPIVRIKFEVRFAGTIINNINVMNDNNYVYFYSFHRQSVATRNWITPYSLKILVTTTPYFMGPIVTKDQVVSNKTL